MFPHLGEALSDQLIRWCCIDQLSWQRSFELEGSGGALTVCRAFATLRSHHTLIFLEC